MTLFPWYLSYGLQSPTGPTDCTLPITWALQEGKAVDVFVVLTNNPLWTFAANPVETLKKHREVGVSSLAVNQREWGGEGLQCPLSC